MVEVRDKSKATALVLEDGFAGARRAGIHQSTSVRWRQTS